MAKSLRDYELEIAILQREAADITAGVRRAVAMAQGSSLKVALVGCGKRKKPTTVGLPAHELYTGVPFRLAFQHARETADDVHILSALHGLVNPFSLLAPYDFSMVKLAPSKHLEWGRRVLADLRTAYPLTRLNITFYSGQQYIRPIMRAVTDEFAYWTFENPLDGLDMFERISWFKEQEKFWNPPF